MSVEISQLRAGSIVWAVVRDRHGYRKRRPAIVLTPDAEISADQPLVLMAITTTFPDPPPFECIELPWNPDRRRVTTGLARRSAAVLTWLDTAYPDEITGIIGQLPPRILHKIQDRLRGLEEHDA